MAHVNLPKTNQTGVNEWADVQDNDDAIIAQLNGSLDATNLAANAVTTAKLADDAVTAAKIAANSVGTAEITDANVTDAKLASPNNSVYRTHETAEGFHGDGRVAGTYLLGSSVVSSVMQVSGTALDMGAGTAGNRPPRVFYLDDADYTVAGRTTKLRLRAQVLANATAPAINFTFGLYPVTVAGVADAVNYTAGTVVTGSTVAINAPPASTPTSGTGTDFNVPADGHYLLAVVTSGAIAAISAVSVHAQLQMRHV